MDEMLTLYAHLTEGMREALQGKLALCLPLSPAEARVLGEAIETLPGLVDMLHAELPEASPKVAELLYVASTLLTMIRAAHRQSFFAGALSAPEIGRVQ